MSPAHDPSQATGEYPFPAEPSTLADAASTGPQPSPLGTSSLRYRAVRFHARGGLGEVHVAEDEELHRTVALKRLQEQHAESPASRQRFVLEAEITGRLEHPGVVPVYGLLHDEAGRPCYAMRFIEGETLHEAIANFHSARTTSRDPGERTLALRQLLSRFVAVCQAVAFAHSKGVLHRDLKPANVMLGKFGETLTVDWGLAKSMDQGTLDTRAAADTVRAEDSSSGRKDSTRQGETLGTPAFMSPEQAAGRWDVVGPASDIYSLGATLYVLLTGSAPFRADSVSEVLTRVQRGEFPPPRQVNPAVPPALAAVCCKAMALRPEDRYGTAQELAADVERWLGDEPVTVYREPLVDRLRRWARRHRTLVTGAAAVVVTAFGGVLLIAGQREFSRRELEQEQAKTAAANKIAFANAEEATRQKETAEKNALEASKQKEAAEKNATEASKQKEAAEKNATEATRQKEAAEKNATEATKQKEAAEKSATEAKRQKQRAAENFARARDAVDLMLTRVSEDKQLLRYQPGMTAVRRRLLEEALSYYQGFLKEDEADFEVRREAARAYLRVAAIQQELGHTEKAEAAVAEVRRLTAKLLKEAPQDTELLLQLVHCSLDRAWYQFTANHIKEARAALDEAAVDLERLPEKARNDAAAMLVTATLFSHRGVIDSQEGDKKEAEKNLRGALEILEKLRKQVPDVPEVNVRVASAAQLLAAILTGAKRFKDAEPFFKEALDILKHLEERQPEVVAHRTERARAQGGYAQLLMNTGRPDDAERMLASALALRRQLAADYPLVPDYRFDIGSTLNDFGYLCWVKKDKKKAEIMWREAMDVWDRLVADVPNYAFYRASRSGTAGNLAKLLLERNAHEDALPLLLKATEDDRILLKDNPKDELVRFHFRNNSCDLFTVYLRQAKHATAREAAVNAQKFLPDYPDLQYNLACCLSLCVPLAENDKALSEEKRKELAKEYGDQALKVLKELAAAKAVTADQLKGDTDFDAIRSRDEFQALLKMLK